MQHCTGSGLYIWLWNGRTGSGDRHRAQPGGQRRVGALVSERTQDDIEAYLIRYEDRSSGDPSMSGTGNLHFCDAQHRKYSEYQF